MVRTRSDYRLVGHLEGDGKTLQKASRKAQSYRSERLFRRVSQETLEQCDHRPGSQLDKTTSEFAFSDMISPLIYCSSCHQPELRDFCQKQGIVVTSYSPLGSDRSPLMTEPIVLRLAEKHSVTPATILISLQTSLPNTTVLPKSVTPERIKDNAEVIQLSEDEIKELVTLSDTSPYRACGPE